MMKPMPPQVIDQVASYFQVLSEPMRLRLLNLLREREYNVGELAQACGTTAANVSRHLSLMTKHSIVAREERGTSVYFSIADQRVDDLCELVCGSIASRMQAVSAVHDALKTML